MAESRGEKSRDYLPDGPGKWPAPKLRTIFGQADLRTLCRFILTNLWQSSHKLAISNGRLVAFSGRNVTFRWRDSAQGNKKRLMSRFYTCQLCGANSFDYPVELQRHARELASRPAEWTPWNYRETLAQTVSLLDSAGYDESLMAGKGRL